MQRREQAIKRLRDLPAAIIASTVANAAPFVKRSQPLTPRDFMPGSAEEKVLSPEEAADVFRLMFGPGATKESVQTALKRWN